MSVFFKTKHLKEWKCAFSKVCGYC